MPITIPTKEEVALALDRVAEAARLLLPAFVSVQADGSGSAQMLARRDAFHAFPAPANVLFIDASGLPDGSEVAPSWTLIRFDLSRPGINEVNFVGHVTAEELPSRRTMLSEQFGIEDSSLEKLSIPRLVSMWDDMNYVFLASHDIRTEPNEYGQELGKWIGLDSKFAGLFLQRNDFNAKYGLTPDPVLPASELLRLHSDAELSPSPSPLRRFSLSELQEDVADIQLIPQVPDGVREIIWQAKQLYIYGFFEYRFFTIASHYTYAAVEAALRSRWALCLPIPSTLKFKDREFLTERTGYWDIESCCTAQGWKLTNLLVNGKHFPRTSDSLLSWLQHESVINDWQKWRFGDVYSKLRNLYSHMDGCSFHGGDSEALEDAVEQINILFDSVPLATRPINPAE